MLPRYPAQNADAGEQTAWLVQPLPASHQQHPCPSSEQPKTTGYFWPAVKSGLHPTSQPNITKRRTGGERQSLHGEHVAHLRLPAPQCPKRRHDTQGSECEAQRELGRYDHNDWQEHHEGEHQEHSTGSQEAEKEGELLRRGYAAGNCTSRQGPGLGDVQQVRVTS